MDTPAAEPKAKNFIEERIEADIASGRWGAPGDQSVVTTRFPPEPNGYLHIGHAKAICLNYGLASKYQGRGILRFDDTNPAQEEQEFVDSIQEDVRWLGFEPHPPTRFASDYFEQMHAWAVELIHKGLAYVDEQTPDEIRSTRGTPTTQGTPSPFRDRPAEESLDLFDRMRRGEIADGKMVLRAKIDMASPNFNLRDPVMYRVLNAPHHRTGNTWHIYPMYDWAHGFEDSIEGITHSICTLEFEDHRPLYDWFIDAVNKDRGPDSKWGQQIHHPQQIEFARLNPTYIITSKRKLRQLVEEKRVDGWDDPRMPTISGMRRRGVTAESIRNFVTDVGVTKFNASHDLGLLENAIREHLNRVAPRRMAVFDPLKVTITNWAEHGESDRLEEMPAINNPEDESAGHRNVLFGESIFIERDDFMVDAPKKFFRLKPGGEVRLRYGYWITCHDFATDADGNPAELFCSFDPQTKGGDSPPPDAEGKVRKVKGTLHWVAQRGSVPATVRLYDRLFSVERPGKPPKNAPSDWDWTTDLNPDSLRTIEHALVESNWSTGGADPDWRDSIRRFQFERQGYFCLDSSSTDANPIFNRTVSLKDSWAKQQSKR